MRHHVLAGARGRVEIFQRRAEVTAATGPECAQAFQLLPLHAIIDDHDGERGLLVFNEVVHADDDALFRFHRALRDVGRVADLLLYES